jgi:hypothetical protein
LVICRAPISHLTLPCPDACEVADRA